MSITKKGPTDWNKFVKQQYHDRDRDAGETWGDVVEKAADEWKRIKPKKEVVDYGYLISEASEASHDRYTSDGASSAFSAETW